MLGSRKTFPCYAVAFRAVQVDSEKMQKDGVGNEIRKQLKVLTGAPTIPQIFVGGQLLGGNDELFVAFMNGELQTQLNKMNVKFEIAPGLDPTSLLPRWLQPRKSA